MAQEYRIKRQLERERDEKLAAEAEERAQWTLKTALWRKLLAAGLSLTTFVVYVLTLCPEVPGGDSGELIGAAYSLGVAHPPGYPLYLMLSKIFTWIPLENIAWRVNLFSAFCNSIATAFIFLAAAQMTRNLRAAFLAGGLFAFSPLIWRYSVVAEVFGLNNLFAAALIFLTVKFYYGKELRTFYQALFVFSLGLSNHHTLLFVGVPLLGWMAWEKREFLTTKSGLLKIVLFGTLGFLPYLYLPLRSNTDALVSWGNSATFGGFLTHFLRSEYGTFKLGSAEHKQFFLVSIWYYLKQIPTETLYVGGLLALFGIYSKLKDTLQGKLVSVLFGSFLFYTLIFHLLANLDISVPHYRDVHSRFWQQSNLFLFLFIAIGFAQFESALKTKFDRPWTHYLTSTLAVLAVTLQISLHYSSENQSKTFAFRKFGEAVLNSLPQDSLLIGKGDYNTNVILYLQATNQIRTDVAYVDSELFRAQWARARTQKRYPTVAFPDVAVHEKQKLLDEYPWAKLIEMNLTKRPVFLAFHKSFGNSDVEKAYKLVPYGLVYRVVPNTEKLDLTTVINEHRRAISLFDATVFAQKFREGDWQEALWNIYWKSNQRVIEFVMTQVARGPASTNTQLELPKILRFLANYMEASLKHYANAPVQFFKTQGIIYFELLKTDPTVKEKLLNAWNIYITRASTNDSDLARIRNDVARLSQEKAGGK